MDRTMIFGIAFVAAVLAMAGQASALDCNSYSLTSLHDYFGNPAFIYYENPSWTPPTVNLTVTLGGLTLLSGSNPVNDFSGNIYTWQLNASSAGTYTVGLTASDGNNTCPSKTVVLPILAKPLPVINPTMDDIQEQVIGQAFNVNAYLNNIGNAPAYNVTGIMDILNANTNSPQFTATINNGTSATQTFQVTPANTCAYYRARVQVDYYNQNGEQMQSVYVSDDFNVSGADLVVETVTLPASAVGGSAVALSATVRNTGRYTSQAFNVDFYDGNPSSGGTLIATGTNNGTLAANATATVTATWAAASGIGVAEIYAVITNSMECFTGNNQGSANMTITATCGDGYCNGGEGCSTCANDCGVCPPPAPSTSGGFGGGGGGGGAFSCIMNYTCTEWSDCTPAGIQTRSCEYAGNCPSWYLESRKPELERECRYNPPIVPSENVTIPGGEVPEENETTTNPGGLTGFITANPAMSAGIIVALIIILAAVYYGIRSRKKEGEGGKEGVPEVKDDGQAFKYSPKKTKGGTK